MSTNTTHTRCKTPMCRQTCFYDCPRKPQFVNDCTTRNTFVSEQQQQQQNPCTVIPRRALPPFSALLHFSLKLENQKFLNFHRSNHFSQNLLRNKAESSCSLQLRVTQTPMSSPELHQKHFGNFTDWFWCSLSQGKNSVPSVS